ncbi:hypothetical protein HCH_04218 [Hahella chejuensis KCTC 2396]|uniref:Uncharacterized protein n=1 Tax=Hahella chejuensis (strain KCTC 2396) TaxID=349521 RepID=Q2SEJ9_HAHCH|nr:hypothetical protein HCH_04218 [Hahella chejuensis KCTC 2396]
MSSTQIAKVRKLSFSSEPSIERSPEIAVANPHQQRINATPSTETPSYRKVFARRMKEY